MSSESEVTPVNMIASSKDYYLTVQETVVTGETQLVYAVINKIYGVVEAEVPFLTQALTGIKEMQEILDKHRKGEDEDDDLDSEMFEACCRE